MERRRTHVPNIVPQQSAWLIRHEVLNPTLVQAPVSISRRPRLAAARVVRERRVALPSAEILEAHRSSGEPGSTVVSEPVAHDTLDVGHAGVRQDLILAKTAVCGRDQWRGVQGANVRYVEWGGLQSRYSPKWTLRL